MPGHAGVEHCMARLPREALLSLTARLCGELSSGEPLELSGTDTALLCFAVRLCELDALARRAAKEWLAAHAAALGARLPQWARDEVLISAGLLTLWVCFGYTE